ncbi:hypothetical protein [Yoonia sp. I 8.24]|uniref:hypothetical protein n=1 Tax=Yoonia sp. I 8.24 TaxID=1537229 RepID=UPI001EDEC795|nr:hypothetical protein [Yoonia sp. I 8.24]MCG3266599.1 hypothetical protein [Yoonia sp. I 8.24]
MDFSHFDDGPLRKAKEGDLKALIDRLREEKCLLRQDEREFLANFLEAKPKKRGPKGEISKSDKNVFEAVTYLVEEQNIKKQAAEMQVAEIVRISDRAVRKIVKKCKDDHFFLFFRDIEAMAETSLLPAYATPSMPKAIKAASCFGKKIEPEPETATVPYLLRNEFHDK